MSEWDYEKWPSIEPNDWAPGSRNDHPDDQHDFHVDLGCGTIKKARIGVDRYEAPGVDYVVDLEAGHLPFDDSSIQSIISHHCLEHIGPGFVALIDECWRVLAADAPFRIIVPLFPSTSAVQDPDHKRYFMEDTFAGFIGDAQNCWLSGFSVPYTRGRFRMGARDMTPRPPAEHQWTAVDAREMRLTLYAVK